MSAIQRPLVRHLNVKTELNDIPPEKQQQLKHTFQEISHLREPTTHPKVRHLSGHRSFYRLRIGQYRAVFDKFQGTLRVLLIGHRDSVYRRLDVADTRAQQR